MNVCFAGFDVVVEVISKSLDMRYHFCLSLWREMSWEEYCGAISMVSNHDIQVKADQAAIVKE